MSTLTKVCRVCSQEVPSQRMGRPRTYCSLDCRRQMESMRRELFSVEDQIAEARQLARDGFAPGPRVWTEQAEWLAKAAAELRLRIGEELP
jgi:hypothetical protein